MFDNLFSDTPIRSKALAAALDTLSLDDLHSSTLTMLSLLQSRFAEECKEFEDLKSLFPAGLSHILFRLETGTIDTSDLPYLGNMGYLPNSRFLRYQGQYMQGDDGCQSLHGRGRVTEKTNPENVLECNFVQGQPVGVVKMEMRSRTVTGAITRKLGRTGEWREDRSTSYCHSFFFPRGCLMFTRQKFNNNSEIILSENIHLSGANISLATTKLTISPVSLTLSTSDMHTNYSVEVEYKLHFGRADNPPSN